MTRISLRAVPFDHPQAQALLAALYADQLTRYERADPPHEPASDYAPPHGLFLLLYVDNQSAGCGGYRAHDAATGEIKRLYVCPDHRGQGYGRRILTELESHARTVGARSLVLETGVHNTAAMALFVSAGYSPIPGYATSRDPRINRAFRKPLPVTQR